MKQFFVLFLIVFISISTSAQITFEKGYYIDNSGQKIECLIRNMDWRTNPTDFKYKGSKSDKSREASLEDVQEFGVYNVSKYIRSKVKIDRSPNQLDKLANGKDPIFQEEILFLKVLLEGKANLYLYQESDHFLFFYKKDGFDIQQLIFKTYMTKTERDYDKVKENTTFRSQIWEELKCADITVDMMTDLKYGQKDLIQIFTKYNKCYNSESVFFWKKKQNLFHLTLKPRLNYSSFEMDYIRNKARDLSFNKDFNFGIGLELEYVLPFYKNKWALVLEPTYQHYQNSQISEFNTLDTTYATFRYNALELPLGVKHYFFLNEKSKIYLSGLVILDFNFDSSVDFNINEKPVFYSIEAETGINFGFGIGYQYNNRYSLELRYTTSRDNFFLYTAWLTDFKTISIMFGYSFL